MANRTEQKKTNSWSDETSNLYKLLLALTGSIVEIFNGTSFIAMRSIASKLVPTEELGKVNSLFGVCEALMPLVYGPMYSATYAATMETMPGAFLLLGGGLTVPAVIIFGWMYIQHRRDAKELKTNSDPEKAQNDEKTQNGVAVQPEQPQTNSILASQFLGIENAAFEMEKYKL
ncbi:MFS transporter [Holotrichia oblita]|uniref:MFS transporter n=1 Tax=Holotrichia oblita TaxID=644536 RepID=A0ACB9ST69_HOLOL|nr:MFS transporter [Holotrichia oblita]